MITGLTSLKIVGKNIFIMAFIKKILIWAVIIWIGYFILSHHFIIIGHSVKVLKKSHLTLEYTIYNAKGKSNKTILAIDELREDGIGDILLEAGLITEKDLDRLIESLEEEGS